VRKVSTVATKRQSSTTVRKQIMQFEASTQTNASSAAVFSLYANVSGWPTWDPDVKAASVNGDFVSGAKGVIAPNGGPKSEIIFTEVVEGKKFAAQCKLPLCTMRFEHELNDAKGKGTQATHRVIFQGPLAPLFGRLIGSGMRKTLPHALAGLKQAAEARN
jgi:Polyketide cyclase / dehydrase and lipid transport